MCKSQCAGGLASCNPSACSQPVFFQPQGQSKPATMPQLPLAKEPLVHEVHASGKTLKWGLPLLLRFQSGIRELALRHAQDLANSGDHRLVVIESVDPATRDVKERQVVRPAGTPEPVADTAVV